ASTRRPPSAGCGGKTAAGWWRRSSTGRCRWKAAAATASPRPPRAGSPSRRWTPPRWSLASPRDCTWWARCWTWTGASEASTSSGPGRRPTSPPRRSPPALLDREALQRHGHRTGDPVDGPEDLAEADQVRLGLVLGHQVLELRGQRRHVQAVARHVERERVEVPDVAVAGQDLGVVARSPRRPHREQDRGRGDRVLPGELRVGIGEPLAGHVPEVRRVLRVEGVGAHDLLPAAVDPGRDEVDLVHHVLAVLGVPQEAGHGVEGVAEGVPDAV